MEKCIKLAIENGVFGNPEVMKNMNWHRGKGNEEDLIFFDNGNTGVMVSLHKTLLRPEFWQALGKGLGWEGSITYIDGKKREHWELQWHRFIDHLASGGDIDSFFNELIK